MNSQRSRVIAWSIAFVTVASLASLLRAATVPESVPLGKFVRVKLDAGEKAIVLSQDFSPVDIIATQDSLAFTGLPGRYVVVVLKGDEQPQQFFTKIVGLKPEPKPDPKPDDPPKPPVDPLAPPSTAPLPDVPGFRVLMIYESGTLPPDIPKEQHEIPYLPTVRDWLTQNTTPENGWAGWRVGDPQSIPQTSNTWSKMLALPRSEVPWLVVNNGDKKVGYSGPMPKNATDFLKLVEGLK